MHTVQHLAAGSAGGLGKFVEQDAGQREQSEHHLGQAVLRIRRIRCIAEDATHGLAKDRR
jgi:hypothetical protein